MWIFSVYMRNWKTLVKKWHTKNSNTFLESQSHMMTTWKRVYYVSSSLILPRRFEMVMLMPIHLLDGFYEWISTCLWSVDLKYFQQFSNKIPIKNRYFRNKNVCFYLKFSLIWTRAIYIYISAETLKHSPDNIFTRKQRRHKLITIIDYYRNLGLIYFLITNTHA